MAHLILLCIRAYQQISRSLIAARFPLASWSGCRQWPTCSDYAAHAITTHGVLAGIRHAAVRMARCHPFVPTH